ncbi:MAG: GxxExxY protein [candidate division WOR-3 bacterium]|nr:MAG: GxxExxY protein [candidate division WOR-3 bacterium]
MQTDGLLHKELTYRIIGILSKVHGNLGCGFTEKIYQRAIEIELNRAGILFETEKEINIPHEVGFLVNSGPPELQ